MWRRPHQIWKGYSQAADYKFQAYIEHQKTRHDNERDMYTAPRLMEFAENKYKSREAKDSWRALSAEQEEIAVMKAQMEKLSNKLTLKTSKTDMTMKGTCTLHQD